MIYPETYDYKNLERVMNYIQVPLILSINKYRNIKWYIDSKFALHKDIRSHNSGFKTAGILGAYIRPIKQKLNTKSSTDANIFIVDDVLTQFIWSRYFLK